MGEYPKDQMPTEEEFMVRYGDIQATFGSGENKITLPIRDAIVLEGMGGCAAPEEKRQSKTGRMKFLAIAAGVENLAPEHRWLTELEDKEAE